MCVYVCVYMYVFLHASHSLFMLNARGGKLASEAGRNIYGDNFRSEMTKTWQAEMDLNNNVNKACKLAGAYVCLYVYMHVCIHMHMHVCVSMCILMAVVQ